MGLLDWLAGKTRSGEDRPGGPRKWLPVIDADYCTGCGRCVEGCPSGCLELVWSFATVTHPDRCTGAGDCVANCPDELIRMDWQPAPPDADRAVGRWQADGAPPVD